MAGIAPASMSSPVPVRLQLPQPWSGGLLRAFQSGNCQRRDTPRGRRHRSGTSCTNGSPGEPVSIKNITTIQGLYIGLDGGGDRFFGQPFDHLSWQSWHCVWSFPVKRFQGDPARSIEEERLAGLSQGISWTITAGVRYTKLVRVSHGKNMQISTMGMMGGLANGLQVIDSFCSDRARQSISEASASSGLGRAGGAEEGRVDHTYARISSACILHIDGTRPAGIAA